MDKRLSEANKLENEARKLKNDYFNEQQSIKRKEQAEWEKNENIDVYAKSDYAGLKLGEIEFYYGYEDTFCEEHGSQRCVDFCDKSEWAFTVRLKGEEVIRIPQSKLHPKAGEEVMFYLLAGIGHYLKRKEQQDD